MALRKDNIIMVISHEGSFKVILHHDFKKFKPTAFSFTSIPQGLAVICGFRDGTISLNLQQPRDKLDRVRGLLRPDPDWHRGHPDAQKQEVVSVCNLSNLVPQG